MKDYVHGAARSCLYMVSFHCFRYIQKFNSITLKSTKVIPNKIPAGLEIFAKSFLDLGAEEHPLYIFFVINNKNNYFKIVCYLYCLLLSNRLSFVIDDLFLTFQHLIFQKVFFFSSPSWLKREIGQLAWKKINTLLHFVNILKIPLFMFFRIFNVLSLIQKFLKQFVVRCHSCIADCNMVFLQYNKFNNCSSLSHNIDNESWVGFQPQCKKKRRVLSRHHFCAMNPSFDETSKQWQTFR